MADIEGEPGKVEGRVARFCKGDDKAFGRNLGLVGKNVWCPAC